MDQDLKIIKKKYGENMAKLCRSFFPTLLEEDGLLSTLMLNYLAPNHSLYQDLIDQGKENEFKNYIYSLVNMEMKKELNLSKTPKELLSEAGYNLYECKTEEEIQHFKKYYAKGEKLCTFNGGRLNSCRVFFAVKKDVDEINRDDYPKPQRQDRYGTSVISIQFTKDPSHILSIKNRYNHIVDDPDSTFSNNLDNIIEGLTESFRDEYGLIQQCKNINLEISGYVRASDGKYYKYNREMNNIYYCPNNIIIDNFKVKRYEKEKYVVMDYFILDLVNKKLSMYDKEIYDAILDTVDDIEKIGIERKRKGLEKIITIKVKDKEDIKLVLNKNNEIIKLTNPNVEKIGNNFLFMNNTLQELNLPNVKEVGNSFLYWNESLKKIDLPNLKEIGSYFLYKNEYIKELNLPKVEEIDYCFLYCNKHLERLSLPNLQRVYNNFLHDNECLNFLDLPKLKEVGDFFLYRNNALQEVNLPNLQEVGSKFLNNSWMEKLTLPNLQKVGDEFLSSNIFLQELSLPKVEEIEDCFLYSNNTVRKLDLPNLKKIGSCFLHNNNSLLELTLPKLEEVRSHFLDSNVFLQKLSLPNLQEVSNDFLFENISLKTIYLPSLQIVGTNFLYKNNALKKVKLPNLKIAGTAFLCNNNSLQKLDLSSLQKVDFMFLQKNNSIKILNLPNLYKIGDDFLSSNETLQEINCPKLDQIGSGFLKSHPIFDGKNFKDNDMSKVKQKVLKK